MSENVNLGSGSINFNTSFKAGVKKTDIMPDEIQIFDKFDKNADGELSQDEINEMLENLGGLAGEHADLKTEETPEAEVPAEVEEQSEEQQETPQSQIKKAFGDSGKISAKVEGSATGLTSKDYNGQVRLPKGMEIHEGEFAIELHEDPFDDLPDIGDMF